MKLETLIETYGFWAILVGTFLEGETVLIVGGFVARLGYMSFEMVLLAAFVGSTGGDQLAFYLGRAFGHRLLSRFPSWHDAARKVLHHLNQHHSLFIVTFRFLYGLRTVSSLAIGMTHVGRLKFLLLNFLGAALWSVAIASAGYLLGGALTSISTRVRHYELGILAAVILIGAAIRIAVAWRRHRHEQG